jgi:hypothetical protein
MNPRRGWRIYFWIMAALLAVFVVVGFIKPGSEPLLDVVDYLVSAFTLVGLFGYAYSRRIWSQGAWRVALPIVVIWEFVNTARGLTKGDLGNVVEAAIYVALIFAIVVPAYVALYRYGYRSPELWTPATPK